MAAAKRVATSPVGAASSASNGQRANADRDVAATARVLGDPDEYACFFEGCNQVFKRQTALKNHIEATHIDGLGGQSADSMRGSGGGSSLRGGSLSPSRHSAGGLAKATSPSISSVATIFYDGTTSAKRKAVKPAARPVYSFERETHDDDGSSSPPTHSSGLHSPRVILRVPSSSSTSSNPQHERNGKLPAGANGGSESTFVSAAQKRVAAAPTLLPPADEIADISNFFQLAPTSVPVMWKPGMPSMPLLPQPPPPPAGARAQVPLRPAPPELLPVRPPLILPTHVPVSLPTTSTAPKRGPGRPPSASKASVALGAVSRPVGRPPTVRAALTSTAHSIKRPIGMPGIARGPGRPRKVQVHRMDLSEEAWRKRARTEDMRSSSTDSLGSLSPFAASSAAVPRAVTLLTPDAEDQAKSDQWMFSQLGRRIGSDLARRLFALVGKGGQPRPAVPALHFAAQVVGLGYIDGSAALQLLRWYPEGVIPDEWVPLSDGATATTRTVPLSELPLSDPSALLLQPVRPRPQYVASPPVDEPAAHTPDAAAAAAPPEPSGPRPVPKHVHVPAVMLGRDLLCTVKTLYERGFISFERKIELKVILLCDQRGPLFPGVARLLSEARRTRYFRGCADAIDELLRAHNLAVAHDLVRFLQRDAAGALLDDSDDDTGATLAALAHRLAELRYPSLAPALGDIEQLFDAALARLERNRDRPGAFAARARCTDLRDRFRSLAAVCAT